MNLLIFAQVVDQEHPVLGFFHEWIRELASRYTNVHVICLYEGSHTLPTNVRVHSLGKDRGYGRLVYIFRFYTLVWRLRNRYDAVFVHMNQEYVLMGGLLWKVLRKRIYMWRNHYAGSWLTDAAAFFCTKIFCTSKHSYTARYRKTVLMPVGVDTNRFYPNDNVPRKPNSILFLARMAPSKKPLMLLDALKALKDSGVPFTATFVGSPLPKDEAYYRSLVGRAEHYSLTEQVTFIPGVAPADAPDLYRAHQIFVNTSPSGMLDKTIFEAAACGCSVLARSEDYTAISGSLLKFENAQELSECLHEVLSLALPPAPEQFDFVKAHALGRLCQQMKEEIL